MVPIDNVMTAVFDAPVAMVGWTKVWKTAPYTVTAGNVTGD